MNRPLGYVGLDAYASMEEGPINSIFLHSEHQTKEYLGKNWIQMAPRTLAFRLTEYIM